MRESAIESKCKKIAMDKGYRVRKISFILDTGCPDRIFFKEKHFFWCEFKAKNGVLSAKQIFTIKKLKEAGQEVYIIDDIEEFKKIIK